MIASGIRAIAALRRALRPLGPDLLDDRAGEDGRRATFLIRVLLAATALITTRIDPSEPSRFVGATYSVLAVYLGYALSVWWAARRNATLVRRWAPWLLWIDVGVYALLIGLTGGSNSIYFVLFFFVVLIAAFEGGFGYGVVVSAVSVVLFIVVGYATRPADPLFDLNRFLIRSTSLPMLGYLMAYRGGYELRLRRRLALLREISLLSNPRFGPNRMLSRSLDQLRAFFDADSVVAVLPPRGDEPAEVRRVARDDDQSRLAPGKSFPRGLPEALMPFVAGELVCYRPRAWRPLVVSLPGELRPRDTSGDRGRCEQISELLGAPAFLSVPLRARSMAAGRLYVAAADPRFDPRDAEFVLQAADQLMPALAHIELVERMSTRAAEEERERIALDIHDRIIQPYIGLQIGISAVAELAAPLPDEHAMVRNRVGTLSGLAAAGLSDLRGYVSGLREPAPTAARLSDSLHRFAERFREATGIHVSLDLEPGLELDERLAAEVFSMTSEAISNVRRHTDADSARVSIGRRDEAIVLRVENPADRRLPACDFLPRSIARRAALVSGSLTVESTPDGATAVTVEIPL